MSEELKPQNQEDVNPTTQQDKIIAIEDGKVDEPMPKTTGTGGNRPVSTPDTLKITKKNDEEE